MARLPIINMRNGRKGFAEGDFVSTSPTQKTTMDTGISNSYSSCRRYK